MRIYKNIVCSAGASKSVRFILDECVPKRIKSILQKNRHEVTTLIEIHKQGINNGAVAVYSIAQNAIIITGAEDFLHLKQNLQKQCRVIYIKIHPQDPLLIMNVVKKHLNFSIDALKSPGKVVITESKAQFLPV